MHKTAAGHSREEIVKQVRKEQESVHDYASYVPVGGAAQKLNAWKTQSAEILYLTSRRRLNEVRQIKEVLKGHGFPEGHLLFRKKGEEYKDVAERAAPDILVEDDCESIGGEKEMAYPHIKPTLRKSIKSIVVREFAGIDNLPGNVPDLLI